MILIHIPGTCARYVWHGVDDEGRSDITGIRFPLTSNYQELSVHKLLIKAIKAVFTVIEPIHV